MSKIAMSELLRIVAYPRRGTEEESMEICDAAILIQGEYTLEELEQHTVTIKALKEGGE